MHADFSTILDGPAVPSRPPTLTTEDAAMRHAWMVVVLALACVRLLSGSATAQDKPIELLFKTSKGGSQAIWSLFDKYLKAEFAGVKVLWIWVIPPGHVHLAKKPVRVLEDLAGLKLRVGTPILATMVKALG